MLDINYKNEPGIDIHKLKSGTKINVQTKNSLYEFETVNKPGYLMAKGGKKVPERCQVYFSGSTYGGSMLRIGWICKDMFMEIWLEDDTILTTSRVKNVTIVGNNWKYSLAD